MRRLEEGVHRNALSNDRHLLKCSVNLLADDLLQSRIDANGAFHELGRHAIGARSP